MINQEVHIDVNKPVPAVYDFVVTNYVRNHPRWDPKVLSTQLDGGGALAAGATGKEVRKQMGKEQTYDFRVAELTADHVTFDATGGGTKFGAVWAVKPAGSGSQVSITFYVGFGGVMGLFEPLMKGGVRKEMQQAAERIKQLVEAEA